MTSLELVPGGGRLRRNEHFIAYAVRPVDGIDAIIEADTSVFKGLAGLVVANDFSISPFMVLDLRDHRVFLFGDLCLELGTGEVLNGADSSTWVERVLAEGEVANLNTPGVPATSAPAERTDLQLGCVPAGGFRFSSGSPMASSPLPEDSAANAAGSSDHTLPLVVPDSTSDETSPPDPVVPASVAQAPATWEPAVEDNPIDVGVDLPHSEVAALAAEEEPDDDLDPGWDPLEDPTSVDLASIGAPAAPGDLPPGSEPATPGPEETLIADEPAPDQNHEADHTIIESESSWTPPKAPTTTGLGPPSQAPAPTRSRPPAPISPPPPSVPGGTPLPPTGDDGMIEVELDPASPPPPRPNPPNGAPTAGSAIGGTHGSLLFDDGQRIPVNEGVYVGRFPTKHGVPDGYGSVVIRSEEVSRLHWELVVENDRVFVQDLGSQNGTSLEAIGGQPGSPLSPNELSEIRPGTTIAFGDRWARYEV